ncbi:acyl-CoA N-acyltransferase [Aspergillus crustosus]
MGLLIRRATPSDAPTMATINIEAFRGAPFISNAFPNIPDEIVHPLKQRRYLKKMAHPLTHVIVAEDEESGEVVGCSRWVIPSDEAGKSAKELLSAATAGEKGDGAEVQLELPEGTNLEIYEGFFVTLKEKADEYLQTDDVVLEFLATAPEHQGKGIGKALVRWGTDQADQQQRRIYVEATEQGLPVYAKSGWNSFETLRLDYRRWGGEGGQELTIMIRDPILSSFN